MKLLDRLFRRTFRFHVPNGQDVAFEVKAEMRRGQMIKWFEFRGLENFVQPGEQVSIEMRVLVVGV